MPGHYVHNIDPVLFSLGPLQIRWYGLMYVISFLIGGVIARKLARDKFFKVDENQIDTLVTALIIGMFIGARFFYVFIYNWDYYADNLSELLAVWKGGLSFHGALVGLCTAGYFFGRKFKLTWYEVMDVVALSGAQGLFWGRMGNFINGELFGRLTQSPIGMIFPNGGGPYPRHPSQLYEGILEGIVLSIILWMVRGRTKIYGIISGLFIALYGLFRFIIEFFREPDTQLGYYFNFLTMGQLLCFVMIIVGMLVCIMAYKKNVTISSAKGH